MTLCTHCSATRPLTLWLVLRLCYHTELADQVKSFLNIQVQWFECWINTNVILVETLTFGNSLKCLDGAADELRYIVYTSEDFGI